MYTSEMLMLKACSFSQRIAFFPSFFFPQGSLMDDAHTRTSSHLIWPNAFLMQLVLLKLLISWISSLWISPFTELSQLLDKPLPIHSHLQMNGAPCKPNRAHPFPALSHLWWKGGEKTQFVFAQTINKHRSDQMRHSEPEERSERRGGRDRGGIEGGAEWNSSQCQFTSSGLLWGCQFCCQTDEVEKQVNVRAEDSIPSSGTCNVTVN